MTALYAASCNGHLDVVRYLRDIGADISITDNAGVNPAQAAVMNGHGDVSRYLQSPLSASTERGGGFRGVADLKSEITVLKEELRGMQKWHYLSLSVAVVILAYLTGAGYVRISL